MDERHRTLVNGVHTPGHDFVASGWQLSDNLCNAPNVSVVKEGVEEPDVVSCTQTLGQIAGDWGYLWYWDTSNPGNNAYVLSLQGKGRFKLHHLRFREDGSPKGDCLGVFAAESALHEIHVGPGAIVFLVNVRNKKDLVNTINTSKRPRTVTIKPCPHLAGGDGNDARFLRVTQTDHQQSRAIYTQLVAEITGDHDEKTLRWHWMTEEETPITRPVDVWFRDDAFSARKGAVRISCDAPSCRDVMTSVLVVKDNGIDVYNKGDEFAATKIKLAPYVPPNATGFVDSHVTAENAVQALVHGAEGYNPISHEMQVDICHECYDGGDHNVNTTLQLDAQCIFRFSYFPPSSSKNVVMASFEKDNVFHAFAYNVLSQQGHPSKMVEGHPCAYLEISKDNVNASTFERYNVIHPQKDVPIYLLSKVFNNGEPVRLTLEKFWPEPLAFHRPTHVTSHRCGLDTAGDKQVVLRQAEAVPRRMTRSRSAAAAAAAEPVRPNQPYAPRIDDIQDEAVKAVATYFDTMLRSPDAPVNSINLPPFDDEVVALLASGNRCQKGLENSWLNVHEAKVADFMPEGNIRGIRFEVDAQERIHAFAERLNGHLFSRKAVRGSYTDRKNEGGCLGILVQMPGYDMEIALAIPYTSVREQGKKTLKQTINPQLAVRASGTTEFIILDKPNLLKELPAAVLGLDIPKTMATLFRFEQNNKAHQPESWRSVLLDVETLMERPPLESTNPKGHPRRPCAIKKNAYGGGGGGGGGEPMDTTHQSTSTGKRKTASSASAEGHSKSQKTKPHGGRRSSSSSAAAAAAASASARNGDQEPDDGAPDDNDIWGARNITFDELVEGWPLQNTNLVEYLNFGRKREYTPVIQEKVLEMLRLLVDSKIGKHVPVYNLIAHCNAQLVGRLSPEFLKECDEMADAWSAHHGVTTEDAPCWGYFSMTFVDWVDGVYRDEVGMDVYEVQVPTKDQWETLLTPDQKLELLARMLGFKVFYVNWIRTKGTTPPLRDYHRIIEHIARRMGIVHSTRYNVIPNVRNKAEVAKTYVEMMVYAPKLFATCITTVVGKDAFIDVVMRGSEHETPWSDMGAECIRKLAERASLFTKSLTEHLVFLEPKINIMPLLEARTLTWRFHDFIERLFTPVSICGDTGVGKSLITSFLIKLLARTGPNTMELDLVDGDNDLFVELHDSMVPYSKFPDVHETLKDRETLDKLVKDFGISLATKLRKNEAENVATLFPEGPSSDKDTIKTIDVSRYQSFGKASGTSTHVEVKVRNDNSIPPGMMLARLRDSGELAHIAEADPKMQEWLEEHGHRIAGKETLMIRIPKVLGEHEGEAADRGCYEAQTNVIHGVPRPEDDIKTLLGHKHFLVFPAIFVSIEISRPMRTPLPGWRDLIGRKETNKTLSNGKGRESPLAIVPFVINEDSSHGIVWEVRASDTNTWCIALCNAANGPKAPERHKTCSFAADMKATTSMKIEEEFRLIFSEELEKGLTFVATDVVGGGALLMYLAMDDAVDLDAFYNLPLSLHESNVGGFIFELRKGWLCCVADAMPYVTEFNEMFDKVHVWKEGRDVQLHEAVKSEVKSFDALTLAKAALELSFKGSVKVSDNLSDAANTYVTTQTKPGMKWAQVIQENVWIDENRITDLLKRYDNKAAGIAGLENAARKSRSAEGGRWIHLNRLTGVLLQQKTKYQEAADAQTYGQCKALYEELMEALVGDAVMSFHGLAMELKKRAVMAGVHFLRMILMSMGNRVVVMASTDPVEVEWSDPMDKLLKKLVDITSIHVDNQELSEREQLDTCHAMWDMGITFMDLISQQMCSSSLGRGEAFEAPDVEVLRLGLLHFLCCNTDAVAKTLQGGAQVKQELLRQLERSFDQFVFKSVIDFVERGWHPSKNVLREGTLQTSYRNKAASPIQKDMEALAQMTKTLVREQLLSTCWVEQVAEFVRTIMHFRRKGVRQNDHKPFGRHTKYDHVTDLEAWKEALAPQMRLPEESSSSTEEDKAYVKDRMTDIVEERHGIAIQDADLVLSFKTLRQLVAHSVGFGGLVTLPKDEYLRSIHTPEELEDIRPERLQKKYSDYLKVQQGFVVDRVVKAMGMAIAYMLPTDAADLFPGEVHAGLHYVPTTRGVLLNAHNCFGPNGVLKGQDELGVPDDLYEDLQKCNHDSARVRRALEAYESIQENLVVCLVFELAMAAVAKGRDIAAFILDDEAQTVHEYVFEPSLPVTVPEEIQQLMGMEQDVQTKTLHSLVEKEEDRPLDIVCVYKGTFYLFSRRSPTPPPSPERSTTLRCQGEDSILEESDKEDQHFPHQTFDELAQAAQRCGEADPSLLHEADPSLLHGENFDWKELDDIMFTTVQESRSEKDEDGDGSAPRESENVDAQSSQEAHAIEQMVGPLEPSPRRMAGQVFGDTPHASNTSRPAPLLSGSRSRSQSQEYDEFDAFDARNIPE